MIFRKKLEFGELPPKLTLLLDESDFIKAYDCTEDGTVVVWIKNREIEKQQELEFSLKAERLLSREERENAFPLPENVNLIEMNVKVIKGYRLEAATDVRYETYEVYTNDLQTKITSCEQIYFSPALIGIGNVVGPAVEASLFPIRYSSWSLQEKVNYWVAALYRLRHQTGEMGGHEDDVFVLGLIRKMQMIDANIEAILPLVIRGLATMESISQAELIESFNRRTGLSIVT
jgi:hypothetical protein